MKTALILLLCVTLTSGTLADIQPVGSLGWTPLENISFLPDGTILTVLRNRIEVVDAKTKSVIVQFAERPEMGNVTVSPDGSCIAIVTNPRATGQTTVEIWDVAAQKRIREWESKHRLYNATFSPKAPLLATSSTRDGDIHLWNWETGEYVGKMEGERRPWREYYVRYGSNWRSRTGHGPYPSNHSMAFSPDGQYLVVGSNRPDAEIWDVSTRQLVGHLPGHADWVSIVSYSPDGRRIATAEPKSSMVYLWDAKGGQLVRKWKSGYGAVWEGGEVWKLLFSHDSQRLYVLTKTRGLSADNKRRDDHVRIWDVETGAQLGEFADEPIYLDHLSLSPDEKMALLHYYGDFVVLWDIEHGRRLAFWMDYHSWVWGPLSPDGRFVVGIGSTALEIWDVQSQSFRKIIFPDYGFFRRVAISPDSKTFAVDRDPWIEVRNIQTGKIVAKVPNSVGSTQFTFSSDGKRIAAREGRGIVITDIKNPEKRENLAPPLMGIHKRALDRGWLPDVTHITFSHNDRYLAAADDFEYVHLWKREADRYVHRYSRKSSSTVTDLNFEPGRRTPALFVGGKQVEVWKLGAQAPELLMTLEATGPIQFVHNRRVSPDRIEFGRYLFVNQEGRLQIWDWNAQKPIAQLPIPEYFAVNRDGSVLFTDWAPGDEPYQYQIHIWDVSSFIHPKPVVWGHIKKTALLPNYPNPFNPETWMPYRLEKENVVTIRIYDNSGVLVRTLPLGTKQAGEYLSQEKAVYWDGRNSMGESVASGVYFYTLTAGDFSETRKMVIQR